ncbi:MAG: hypothetical protein WAW52_07200 [Methanothrix sp.]
MLLNRLLDLGEEESVFLAEESWQDLLELPVTTQILQEGLDTDACIKVKDLGIALHLSEPAEIWLLLTDRYSSQKILPEHAEKWRSKIIKTVHANDEDFFSALTEYFSRSLAEELFCDSCSQNGAPLYVEERIERLVQLLQPILPKDESILEVCCGSGMATQALVRLGQHPLSMDSDRCDLCQGLKSELLDPERCFVLDARLLPSIFPARSVHTVLGFMVGLIDDFNWPLWRDILLKASSLAKNRVLFTVYTQKEAELIAKALGEAGWKGRLIDNRDSKGIYDQWAYLAVMDE